MSTELVTYQSNNIPRFNIVRDGISGNYDILLKMIDVTRTTVAFDKGFEDLVKQFLLENNIDGYTPASRIFETIYNFVVDRVKYMPDIAGNVESIKSARQTLQDKYGDCDDLSILFASILAVCGFEPYFCLANYDTTQETFSHIYVVAYDDKENRYVFDAGIPELRFNREVKAKKIVEIGVFADIAELNGLQSLYYQTKQAIKKLKFGTFQLIPELLGILPLGLGYAGTQLVNAGNGLISKSFSDEKSLNQLGSEINNYLADLIVKLENSSIAVDLAKIQAKDRALQLFSKADSTPEFEHIKKSIAEKLNYILSFEITAQKKQIDVIHLNGDLMLITGAAIFGVAGLYAFTNWKNNL